MDQTNLRAKIELLRNSPYFTSNNEQGVLAEKQSIILVLCGKKPVAEATTGRRVQTATGYHSEPQDHAELGGFLTELGLAFSLRSDEYATDAVIALESSLVDEFMRADDAATVGRLFGYPPTAIDAFTNDAVMSIEEQDALMEACGLPLFMPQFRLSKLHAQDEIKILQDWYQTLQAYNFI